MHEGGTTPVRSLIERGLELDNLTDDQRKSLLGIRETFDARESATTAQLEAIYEEMIGPAVNRLAHICWAKVVVLRDHSLFDRSQEAIAARLEAGVEKWRDECREHAANVRGVLTPSQWERIQ